MNVSMPLIGLLACAVVSMLGVFVHMRKQRSISDRAIVDALSSGLLIVDAKGNVLDANPAALTLLNASQQQILGKNAVEVLDIRSHQQVVTGNEHPLIACLAKKKEVRSDPEKHLTITRQDSTFFAARICVSPVFHDDVLHGAVILFQDYTSERQLDYMKTEFIALASHQLRTPLASVQWYSELLATEQQENLSDMQQSFVVELRMAVHRMTTIINELMDVSRLQGGGLTPVLTDVSITELVSAMAQNMKLLADEKGVTCTAHVPSDPVVLHTDSMQMNIVLQNIVSNAIKYSKQGGSVQFTLEEDNGYVCIHVKDNGIGIPEKDQPHVFKKLYRAHNVHKVDVNGSGLGLYCSKKIAKQLGGDITFESEEGKGTVFTVRFACEGNK